MHMHSQYQYKLVHENIIKMVFKVAVVLVLFVAVARAGLLAPAPIAPAPLLRAAPIAAAPVLRTIASAPIAAAPLAKAVAVADADYDPNPQYSYGYDIQDGLTGDSKNHYESRSGDVVQGSYSLIDADGTRRIVEYAADPIHGFNAVVHKEPLAVKAIAPVAAAPIAKIATPLIHNKIIY